MKTKNPYIRKDLEDFIPYKVGDVPDAIKLDANENPYKMDPDIKAQIVQWLEDEESFSIYPDTNSNDLREAIAKFYNVTKEQIVCGVGSDQLIECLIKGLVMPGDKVVYPVPSFSMYQSCITLNHGKGISIELNEDFSYNIDKIVDTCKEHDPKLLILCTPNNPTGNSLSLDEIKEIASRVSCLIMVDEAYGEFTKESAISLINEFNNIVVLRTFSKAYGLASLRIGYGIGSRDAIYPIEITKPPYNLSNFTQIVARKVIENPKLYMDQVYKMEKNKKFLYDELKNLGLKVYPSDANFLLVECDKMNLDEVLKLKNIYIRKMNIRNKTMYRISIGTKDQNDLLIKSIQEGS